MKTNIITYAVLTEIQNDLDGDYLEVFFPLIAMLLVKKNYPRILRNNLGQVCVDFEEEYEIRIPIYVMRLLFTRARKRHVVDLEHHMYLPNLEKAQNFDVSKNAELAKRQYKKVIHEFIRYAKETSDVSLTEEYASDAIEYMLKKNSYEIICTFNGVATIPTDLHVHELNLKYKILLSDYVRMCANSEPELFKYIVDICVGNLIAKVICFNERTLELKGVLSKATVYLDTSFLLALLGCDGDESKIASRELIGVLHDRKTKAKYFQHTLHETQNILNGCINWIGHPEYNPVKASSALKYFTTNSYSKQQVMGILEYLEPMLSKYKIELDDWFDYNNDMPFQVDEEELEREIVDAYGHITSAIEEISGTIYKDIKSIVGIYRLRKKKSPRTLGEAKLVFLTSNPSLAEASRKFEISRSHGNNEVISYPACVTDTFIATSIWLESPMEGQHVQRLNTIANILAAVEPTDSFVTRIMNTAERLKEKKSISPEEFYIARTSPFLAFANRSVFGNPSSISEEMLEITVDNYARQVAYKKHLELQKANERNAVLENEKIKWLTAKKVRRRKQYRKSLCLGIILSWIVLILPWLIVAIINYALYKEFKLLLFGIAAVINIAYGLGIGKLRKKLQACITRRDYRIKRKKLA